MVQKYKQLEQELEQAQGGVIQKQENLCNPGTNFILIKTEYLLLFMGLKIRNKNIFFPKL